MDNEPLIRVPDREREVYITVDGRRVYVRDSKRALLCIAIFNESSAERDGGWERARRTAREFCGNH